MANLETSVQKKEKFRAMTCQMSLGFSPTYIPNLKLWHKPTIPALGQWQQDDHCASRDSLVYTVVPGQLMLHSKTLTTENQTKSRKGVRVGVKKSK